MMNYFHNVWQKYVLRKKFNAFGAAGIRFFHHSPARGNIGDYLCSPRHYFELVPLNPPLNIIGGGVYVDMGVKFAEKYGISKERTILWGVGESIRDKKKSGKLKDLPFLEWGCRDRDRVQDDERFLPCCSCLHTMLDSQVSSDGVLLFLNADPKVSGSSDKADIQDLSRRRGWDLLYNNCAESEFVKALNGARYIVTNSYHGAYWGLLSGRIVTLIGYSSKFYSLLSCFGLSSDCVLKYDRGDDRQLFELLNDVDALSSGVGLDNADSIRSLYRSINVAFLDNLVKRNIVESYRFLPRSAFFQK